MKKKKKNNEYKWQFASLEGTARVKITSGEDIAHLGELDKKLWTVLSSPVTGLEFDEKALRDIDRDGDGKIRVDEVIATAQWLTDALRNRDILMKGTDEIPFSEFSDSENGQKLLASARQILSNLGIEKDSISLAETSDNTAIFAKTRFNGDGVITPASPEDEALSALIGEIVTVTGGSPDRSGVPGVNADQVEAFYGACAAYKGWKDAGTPDIFPFGDNTQAALDACNVLKDKIEDFFMRCRLIAFDEDAKSAVDISVERIGAVAEGLLTGTSEEIGAAPLARPSKEGKLPLKTGINPAWKAAFDNLKALVLDVEFPKADAIDQAQWSAVLDKFGPYTAWMAAKAGAEVEPLGLERVEAILKEDQKEALLALIAEDKALEEEALSIESVDKLVRLTKNFKDFLNNYVSLIDFYDKDRKAIFQCGRLYIDQRSTDLCVRVMDPSRQGDVAALSGMYILYCTCTSKRLGKTMDILAVLTAGDVDGLRAGKNAVFYDRDGNDWDAVVTKVVENPISVRQAFWSPYKKAARWISDKIDKGAADKDSKSLESLTSTADSATKAPEGGAAPKPAFDIARFAGIFAAIGMALGMLGTALAAIFTGIVNMPLWKLLIIIVAILLLISLPSMFIAWRKLRRRDLGPVLNANGWAVNAKSLVRIKFGRTLTSLAKFPKIQAVDPKERRKRFWRTLLWSLLGALVVAAGILYFTDNLGWAGIHRHRSEPVEEVTEAPADEAAEVPAEAAPAEEA